MSSGPRWAVRAVLAFAVLAPLGLAACGVPGATRPKVVADAPKLGTSNGTNPNPPPGPEGAATSLELVRRFLAAAAWGNEVTDDRPRAFEDAVKSVREFIAEDGRPTWQPTNKPSITVVRIVSIEQSAPPGSVVTIRYQPLGLLTDNGKFESRLDAIVTYAFAVERSADGVLRIKNPPQGALLLSDEALRDWYEIHPIYFWDREDKVLVPDLRYLAQAVPEAKRPDEVKNWVLGGPSPWLSQAVNPVPSTIEVPDKLFFEGPLLVVNLAAKAAGAERALGHFMDQLRWSLRPYEGSMELRIGGQPLQQKIDGSSQAYLAANPAGPPRPSPEPEAYFVVGGRVQPVRSGADAAIPALTAAQNTQVESAAITRDKASGALVRIQGGKRQLWLGAFDTEQGGGSYLPTALVANGMSRPAWLSKPSKRVLIAADGNLKDVLPDRSVQSVDGPGLGPITAFAVAPDGRRIALVVGNRVYVADLLLDANRLRVGQAHRVTTQTTTDLTEVAGVAWSREDWIVVAGRNSAGSALIEVTVDGARAEPLILGNLPPLRVTGVVGFPQSPINRSPGFIMIDTNDGVYKVFSRNVDPQAPSPGPTVKPPAPSASAPFFLD
jgi:hypothetical protein